MKTHFKPTSYNAFQIQPLVHLCKKVQLKQWLKAKTRSNSYIFSIRIDLKTKLSQNIVFIIEGWSKNRVLLLVLELVDYYEVFVLSKKSTLHILASFPLKLQPLTRPETHHVPNLCYHRPCRRIKKNTPGKPGHQVTTRSKFPIGGRQCLPQRKTSSAVISNVGAKISLQLFELETAVGAPPLFNDCSVIP